jgi:hypothetical protein
MGDPDANEVIDNTVFGSLVCTNNVVPVQFGDSGLPPNRVRHLAEGECGFNVYKIDEYYLNGGPQPISVKIP